jgi:hypothetical protein
MTTDQFLLLTDAELAEAFAVHPATVDGRHVSVNVERSLIPADADPAELSAWVQRQAAAAIAGKDEGSRRYGAGIFGGQWVWLYRIAHDGGGVSLLRGESVTS